MTAAKSNRVTNVQIPGEAPKAPPESDTSSAASGFAPENEEPKAPPESDMDAIRAQIRDEERAAARAELGEQIQIASQVVGAGAAPRSKSDYRNMRATEIDHTKLTAPVMTRDGWLCPPAPEAKK